MRKKILIATGIICFILGITYLTVQNRSKIPPLEEIQNTAIQSEIETTTDITSSSKPTILNDEQSIEFSFEQYKLGLLNKDSDLAIKYLSQETITYYTDILSLVKTGTKSTIQNRRLIDQLNILIPRYLFDSSLLLKLNGGRDMLTLSIDEGLISEQSVSNLFINSIKVSGNTAFAEIRTEHGIAPQKFRFVKENDVWKFDITSILPESNLVFESIAAESGLSKEAYIYQILESQYGTKVNDNIWLPLI